MRKLLVLLALAASSLVWPGAAVAANGDNLRQITADTSGTACPNIGVGIAFDGVNLLVSCYNDSTITAVRPTDGSQVLHYSVLGANSLGALAWDNGRKVIWACSGFTQVGTIDPVLHTFTPKFSTEGCSTVSPTTPPTTRSGRARTRRTGSRTRRATGRSLLGSS